MNHEQAQARLASLAAGALTGAERKRVQAHVDACSECREQLRDMRSAYSLLQDAADALADTPLTGDRATAVLQPVAVRTKANTLSRWLPALRLAPKQVFSRRLLQHAAIFVLTAAGMWVFVNSTLRSLHGPRYGAVVVNSLGGAPMEKPASQARGNAVQFTWSDDYDSLSEAEVESEPAASQPEPANQPAASAGGVPVLGQLPALGRLFRNEHGAAVADTNGNGLVAVTDGSSRRGRGRERQLSGGGSAAAGASDDYAADGFAGGATVDVTGVFRTRLAEQPTPVEVVLSDGTDKEVLSYSIDADRAPADAKPDPDVTVLSGLSVSGTARANGRHNGWTVESRSGPAEPEHKRTESRKKGEKRFRRYYAATTDAAKTRTATRRSLAGEATAAEEATRELSWGNTGVAGTNGVAPAQREPISARTPAPAPLRLKTAAGKKPRRAPAPARPPVATVLDAITLSGADRNGDGAMARYEYSGQRNESAPEPLFAGVHDPEPEPPDEKKLADLGKLDYADEILPPAPRRPPPPVNPFVLTAKDRQSTFALEADTASYTMARRTIRKGYRPPPAVVRMEEMINAFDYHYPRQSQRTFAVHAQASPAPFGRGLALLKIGVKGKVLGRDGRRASHLVTVIDASGSMGREDRLPLVKHALSLLLDQLDARDRVTLVTYDTRARLHLEAVSAREKDRIRAAIQAIETGASTNLLAGVELGYQMAARHYRAGEINRVILCSDGVANVGPSDAAPLLEKVDRYRRQGVTFTSVGVGSGSYDDRMLEQLANKGDGNYVYIDTREEARRVFLDEMSATLQTIAKDVKIQVEFNPKRVRRYRLIGYENRDIADKDFRNDKVDAGEIGSGQAATALYELELYESPAARLQDLGTVAIRFKHIDDGRVEEFSTRLADSIRYERTPASDPRFFLAACAAEFAELLRGSEHARGGSLEALEQVMIRVANALPLDERVQELLALTQEAQGLPVAQ